MRQPISYDLRNQLPEKKKDAERGKVQAQADLAYLLYKEGKVAEARKWWTLAANQGDVDSQVSLGTLFEEEGNIAEAKKLGSVN